MSDDKSQTTAFPTSTEWAAVDAAMGEHMIPTGWLRFRSYCLGIAVPVLEREWMGSFGMIWGAVQNV